MKNRTTGGRRRTYCTTNGRRKVRHKTLADAKAFRRAISEAEILTGYSRIYRCPDCRGYHLTTLSGTSSRTVWQQPKKGRRSRSIVTYPDLTYPTGAPPWPVPHPYSPSRTSRAS